MLRAGVPGTTLVFDLDGAPLGHPIPNGATGEHKAKCDCVPFGTAEGEETGICEPEDFDACDDEGCAVDCESCQAIPVLSGRGLAVFGLLLLAVMGLALWRRGESGQGPS